ncbi:MAG: aldolase/citrate lyase family protein [Halobacteriales archaeon]|nr:aldolase/citrate lyase family protein [Halobacteriales archaeon]
MTGNSFRDALESDTLQLGAGVVSCSPTIVEAFGRLGLDFVWLDLEHSGVSPNDSTALENLARAADASDTELVVRITSPAPHVVRKVLDASVRNIVIPRIETAEEVRRAVEASRFVHADEPGERGAGLGRANYWGEDLSADYRRREDETALVGVNIENHTAVQNLDEILAVPDLGFVLLGHQDLSVSMGTMPDDAAVQSAIETYRETAAASGVPFGRSVGTDAGAIEGAVEDGYTMLLIGNEIAASREVFGDRIDRFAETS